MLYKTLSHSTDPPQTPSPAFINTDLAQETQEEENQVIGHMILKVTTVVTEVTMPRGMWEDRPREGNVLDGEMVYSIVT